MADKPRVQRVSSFVWEIPKKHSAMRVPARVYASKEMVSAIAAERSLQQLANVATLPGIEGRALAMPDIHQGYGFPIGGVAAVRTEDGVISPGGVGYDINCGVRLLGSDLNKSELGDDLDELATVMQHKVPSGVGRGGNLQVSGPEMNRVLENGARWAVEQGYGNHRDLEVTEEGGCFGEADATCVSDRAKQRGANQLGTIGAGNHFLEVQEVVEVLNPECAQNFGLYQGQVTVMIHTGSRGLGHQVCTDYVKLMNAVMARYHIELPDRELACAPFRSDEGMRYFRAMACAANFAWANRQVITHQVRRAWAKVLKGRDPRLVQVYDVAHNIAKREVHGGKELIVHRKGATRAFGPGSPAVPAAYREFGQPVLIPGSMGTFSFVLAGTQRAMDESFGSCCHGAGRQMSRMKAKKTLDYRNLLDQLEDYGVVVRAGSRKGLLEEAPQAYKDVQDVVDVVAQSGLAVKVAKLRPLAVIKG